MAKIKSQSKALAEIAQELHIDVPILDLKIKGNKLLLYLYGGKMIEYPMGIDSPQEQQPDEQLQQSPSEVGANINPPDSVSRPAAGAQKNIKHTKRGK